MKFTWNYQAGEAMSVKAFLRSEGVSRNFIKYVKNHGGILALNDHEVTTRVPLQAGDRLTVYVADEVGGDHIVPNGLPIEVVYEDRDYLVVNKPIGLNSIPSKREPDDSVAHRVKSYYVDQGYQDQVIHIVTRLDRDTTGLMLIAKHRLAHAMADNLLREGRLERFYYAISQKTDWPDHGVIDLPIARQEGSIITRAVAPAGQRAVTEYWVLDRYSAASLLRLQLHTGRTHQIRVHLSHLGGPLLGDDLYGGQPCPLITSQALHCGELRFPQPLLKEDLVIKLDIPAHLREWLSQQV